MSFIRRAAPGGPMGASPPLAGLRLLVAARPGAAAEQLARLIAPALAAGEAGASPPPVLPLPRMGWASAVRAEAEAGGLPLVVAGESLLSDPEQPSAAGFPPLALLATAPLLLVAVRGGDPRAARREAAALGVCAAAGGHACDWRLLTTLAEELGGLPRQLSLEGAAAGLAALRAGRIAWLIAPQPALLEPLHSGELVALAQGSAARDPLLPALPRPAGPPLPSLSVEGWHALLSPSVALARRPGLAAAVQAALSRPALAARLADAGFRTAGPAKPQPPPATARRELPVL
jgi:hypothetical protein